MNVIQNAIDAYQGYEEKLPAQSSLIVVNFERLFLSGELPTHFLGMSDPVLGRRQYGSLKFMADAVTIAEATKKIFHVFMICLELKL